MVDPIDVVTLEILDDVLAVVVVVAGIDQHCVAVWTDDERGDRLADVDVMNFDRPISRWLRRVVSAVWLRGRLVTGDPARTAGKYDQPDDNEQSGVVP